jgi:hypothetical protein
MAKKPRLSTSVDPELKAEAESKAEELKVSGSEFLGMCLRDGLGHFNDYQENKQLKTQLGEKGDECQRLTQERGNMEGERDYANDSRDKFKEKYGQAQTAYEKSDAQVKAYQQQGIWGRVFGLKPRSMLIF